MTVQHILPLLTEATARVCVLVSLCGQQQVYHSSRKNSTVGRCPRPLTLIWPNPSTVSSTSKSTSTLSLLSEHVFLLP